MFVSGFISFDKSVIKYIKTYLRGLEMPELNEEDMPII